MYFAAFCCAAAAEREGNEFEEHGSSVQFVPVIWDRDFLHKPLDRGIQVVTGSPFIQSFISGVPEDEKNTSTKIRVIATHSPYGHHI